MNEARYSRKLLWPISRWHSFERTELDYLFLQNYLIGQSVSDTGSAEQKLFISFYIAIYNLLNIDRVISKAEVREGREAGNIHRWFTGVLLLS